LNPAEFASIPPWLEPLRTAAVVMFDAGGKLLESNEGFRFTLTPDIGSDAQQRFAAPSFAQLSAMQPGEAGLIYKGMITLNIGHGVTRAFSGAVYHRDGLFLLAAELDISAFELLSSDNDRLRHELEEAKKQLSKRNHVLQRMQDEIEALKRTDGLTGLANLKQLDARLTDEILRWERYRRPLALLLLDLDGFSSVNEEFGRDVGDEMLQHVSTILNAATRTLDLVARYGGEEFAVLMPETNEMGAMIVAERLRMDLEGLLMLPLLRPLTASIGVALLQPEEKRESYYSRAGRAVKFSKANGKNCITMAGVVPECDYVYRGRLQDQHPHG
jgi:diguanylate cyclase (GGDEF)-like protein